MTCGTNTNRSLLESLHDSMCDARPGDQHSSTCKPCRAVKCTTSLICAGLCAKHHAHVHVANASQYMERGCPEVTIQSSCQHVVSITSKPDAPTLQTTKWEERINPPEYPKQQNFKDCGVCTAICASFVAADKPFDYTASDITNYFRKLMAIECRQLTLRTLW